MLNPNGFVICNTCGKYVIDIEYETKRWIQTNKTTQKLKKIINSSRPDLDSFECANNITAVYCGSYHRSIHIFNDGDKVFREGYPKNYYIWCKHPATDRIYWGIKSSKSK